MKRTLLLIFLSFSVLSLADYNYHYAHYEDFTQEYWQHGTCENWRLREYSPETLFYSPPPGICPRLDEDLYRSRGLDPAWGPVPDDGGTCVTLPRPISDQSWIDMNKRVGFLTQWESSRAVAKIRCFPNVERGYGPIIYALCAGKPEMEFLGLGQVKEDVLRNMRDREEEDQLCERMRLLGAQEHDGYYDASVFNTVIMGGGDGHSCGRYDYMRSGVTLFGWPEAGGVWVLKLNGRELGAVGGMERLRNETNVDMETQSQLIEELGGRFYADPVECPELDFLRGPRFALAVVEGEGVH